MSNVIELPRRGPLPPYGDAHISPGTYQACFIGYETWARCRGWDPRVVAVWRITEMGQYFDTVIPTYYRVLSISGKPRRNGRFRIGTRSRLFRDMGRMMYRRPPIDHIPDVLSNYLYVVNVRDVERDQYQHRLGSTKYSVVEHVSGRADRCP